MDIVDQLKYAGDHVLFVPHLHHSAADEIERLREVLKELEWQLKNQLYDAAYETVIHTLWPALKEKE